MVVYISQYIQIACLLNKHTLNLAQTLCLHRVGRVGILQKWGNIPSVLPFKALCKMLLF